MTDLIKMVDAPYSTVVNNLFAALNISREYGEARFRFNERTKGWIADVYDFDFSKRIRVAILNKQMATERVAVHDSDNAGASGYNHQELLEAME